jgi:hypothetical protein
MNAEKPKKVCSVPKDVIEANIKRSQDRKTALKLKLPTYSYPKEIAGNKVRYFHLRNVDENGRKVHSGGATLAMVEYGDHWHVGLSLCSVADNFGRPRGRHDSAGRLDISLRRGTMGKGDFKETRTRKRLHRNYVAKDWTPNGIAADLHLKILTGFFKTPSPSIVDGPLFC